MAALCKSRNIVVGVDGSASSIEALRWAARHAQLTGSVVEVVTVWRYPPAGVVPVVPEGLDFEAEAHRSLDAAIEEGFSGAPPLDLIRVVEEGEPAKTLVRVSKDAALLVVGNRGHGEFVGMLVGSVSEYCVTHANCPVLVVRRQRG